MKSIVLNRCAQEMVHSLEKAFAGIEDNKDASMWVMSYNADLIFSDLFERPFTIRRFFVKIADDNAFRSKFFDKIDGELSESLQDFFVDFDFWRDQGDKRWEFIRSRLLGRPVHIITGDEGVPTRVNDVLSAFSVLNVDSFSERVSVKTALRLGAPDKSLGGVDTLVIASTLSSYLLTLSMMTRALLLEKTEQLSIFAGISKDERSTIDSAWKAFESNVVAFREQLEKNEILKE